MTAWQVAALRGALTAIGTGALAALAMWLTTDSAKQIAVAGLTPFFTVLLARFGIEGTVDSKKA